MEQYLVGNDYCLYAPYYAEDHGATNKPVTISWWDGIDTTGVTPGVIWDKKLSELDLNRLDKSKPFLTVNDDYAENNPTWVIMPMEETDIDEITVIPGVIDNRGPVVAVSTQSGGIDCTKLTENDVIELRMPQYRLDKQTKHWPGTNKLSLWVATGDFNLKPDGSVDVSTKVNQLWGEKKVSRRNVKKKRWLRSDISFVISNWRKGQDDAYFLFGFKKKNKEVKETITTSITVNEKGQVKPETKLSTAVVTQDKTELIASFILDKCNVLHTFKNDEGQGLQNGFRVYRFNGLSFYLEPVKIK